MTQIKSLSAIYELYSEILLETKFLLKNKNLPIYQKEGEVDPYEYPLEWTPLPSSLKSKGIFLQKERDKETKELANFPCLKCENKISGIRHFFRKGRVPILVLHYSGAVNTKEKTFVKTKPNQVFRDSVTEHHWKELIQSVFQFSWEEFSYQEYPACNFNLSKSEEKDWQTRTKSCMEFIENTVTQNQIQGIILLGSSARLVYGQNLAKEKLGTMETWSFPEKKIPVLVTRSPEALSYYEDKVKKQSGDTNLFLYAKEKEDLEKTFQDHLNQFKKALNL